MKKFFLVLGLAGTLCLTGAATSQATTHTTFTGGMGCTCQDADNWVDIMTPSTVVLSCPGTPVANYRDTGISSTTLREYSCSTFVGANPVSTDNISGKVMVSYVDKTCPKGYVVRTFNQPVKLPVATTVKSGTAKAATVSTVPVAYCGSATAPVPSTPK
jgi:hypothetical protein